MAEMPGCLLHWTFILLVLKHLLFILNMGRHFFKELKLIRDIARKNIQQAQSLQKKQYDKASRPASIEVGDIVFVKVQPKFKLDRISMDLSECMKSQELMLRLNQSPTLNVESRTISLQQVSKCRGSFPTNQSWLGHNIIKPRRWRTVRNRDSKYPTSNVNSDTEQTNVPSYRTRYGRKVNPPE